MEILRNTQPLTHRATQSPVLDVLRHIVWCSQYQISKTIEVFISYKLVLSGQVKDLAVD